MIRVLKNPFVAGYAALYLASLLLLPTGDGVTRSEVILVLLIVGFGFSLLAWWTTRGLAPLAFHAKNPSRECTFLAAYLVILVGFLTWGLNLIDRAVVTEPSKSVVILAAKLVVAVLLPLLVFCRGWKYRVHELLPISFAALRHWRPLFWMFLATVGMQAVLGGGLSRIRAEEISGWTLMWGVPFAYLWLALEAGLVEEFFFRVLVQSRVAAWLRSETAGIVVMCLLFGLAHAPGLYLRTSKTMESLGQNPSALAAVAYSIAVVSVAGLFLGILWSRTRNLLLVVLVHAAGDLIPNLVPVLRVWIGGASV
jgi:membrane protease YdiL (CAAX protease family)